MHRRTYNFTADANIGNWPNVLAQAEKLKPAFVLPGHGPAGGPEILTGQSAFMTELVAAVKQAVAQGKKLDDIVTMKDGKPVATSIRLSPAVDHWVSNSLAGHVVNAYKEVTEKKPVGDLPHS